MHMGTHELIQGLKDVAIDEGVVTSLPAGAAVYPGGRIYRKLSFANLPIGCYEWQKAVKDAIAKANAAPTGTGTTTGTGTGTGTNTGGAAPAPQPTTEATTAYAGTPATFDGPMPATIPDLTKLLADPQTPWTTGQYAEACSSGKRYWDGSDWQPGVAP